jgi:hypothetical protein
MLSHRARRPPGWRRPVRGVQRWRCLSNSFRRRSAPPGDLHQRRRGIDEQSAAPPIGRLVDLSATRSALGSRATALDLATASPGLNLPMASTRRASAQSAAALALASFSTESASARATPANLACGPAHANHPSCRRVPDPVGRGQVDIHRVCAEARPRDALRRPRQARQARPAIASDSGKTASPRAPNNRCL